MGLFQKKHETAGQVDMGRLPRHIAIIMDGNGRWAKKRGLPRTAGHKVGAEVFRDIATYCQELGIEYLFHRKLEASQGRGGRADEPAGAVFAGGHRHHGT